MKLLRYLPLIAMICTLSGIAKADPIDFHLVVVDPPSPNPSFTTTSIVSMPVSVTFATCVTGQVGSGAIGTYSGCDSFINATGSALTSLQLVFPDIGALTTQSANCSPDGGAGTVGPNGTSIDFFQSSPTCTVVGSNFVLDYTNGDIPVGQFFTIAESGVAPSDFPTGTLTTTPEPSSVWLMSTGALLLGVFFYYKRRNGLGDQNL